MRILICAVGRLKRVPERRLCEDYLDRARKSGRQVGISGVEIAEIPESRAARSEVRRTQEARGLRTGFVPGARLVCMDERGEHVDSHEFAELVGNAADGGTNRLVFAIGGPDGLDSEIVRDAARTLCFGRMTWPHRLARVMLAEQIYRAVTLMAKHPYHRA